MTRCAIYIRKSRDDGPSHRLTVQREQLPAHARSHGWAVSIYDDGHASAARGKAEDLRERARLEADIRAGKIDLILCIELSRLSRDDSMQDYTAWLHLCSQHHVRLATPSRILDPAQHSDWMLLLMEGGFSSVEMRVLQARMKEGRAQAYRAGKYLGGNPPIPYRYDRAQGLIVDPDQLPIFRRMLKLAETLPAKEVARRVGLPHIAVRRAIADDRLLFYQALRIDPATGETIPGQWPPVIDADQAEKIRAARIHKRSGYHRREHAGLLSNMGLLICGYCKRPYRAGVAGRTRKDGTKLKYYGCPGKDHRGDCPDSRMIQQHIIDAAVTTNLLGTLARLEDLHRLWIESRQTNPAEQIAAIDRETATLRTKKQRLVAAIAEGIIDWTDARAQSTAIETALADLTQQRANIAHTTNDPPPWEDLAIIADHWPDLEATDQRAAIRSTIEQIRISATYMVISYKFPRNADGTTTSRVHLPAREPTRPKNTKAPST